MIPAHSAKGAEWMGHPGGFKWKGIHDGLDATDRGGDGGAGNGIARGAARTCAKLR